MGERASDEYLTEALLAHLDSDDDSALPDVGPVDEFEQQMYSTAMLALAISRGELTLGTYLRSRREASGLSTGTAGRAAKLADSVVVRVEQDRGLQGVDPARLAALARQVGGVRRVLVALVESALEKSGSPTLNSGLTRTAHGTSPALRARMLRDSGRDDANADPRAEYVRRFANAFDSLS